MLAVVGTEVAPSLSKRHCRWRARSQRCDTSGNLGTVPQKRLLTRSHVSCAARPLPVVVSGSGNWCSSCNARAHLLARSNLVAGGGAATVVAAGNDPGREAKHASRCEHALTFARHKRTRLSSRRNPADVLRGSMRSGGK